MSCCCSGWLLFLVVASAVTVAVIAVKVAVTVAVIAVMVAVVAVVDAVFCCCGCVCFMLSQLWSFLSQWQIFLTVVAMVLVVVIDCGYFLLWLFCVVMFAVVSCCFHHGCFLLVAISYCCGSWSHIFFYCFFAVLV